MNEEANYHIPTGTARTCTVTAAWQPLENGSKSPGDVDYGTLKKGDCY